MNEIELDQLSPEQIEELEANIAAKKLAEKNAKKQEIMNYKSLVKETVSNHIVLLANVSSILSDVKAKIYGSLATVIELKQELFGAKSGQQSHTFSDDEGNSITIGWRTIDKYDDTLDMGIDLVKQFMSSLATDEKSAKLVRYLEQLLKKDSKGNLKPNRVVELLNTAEEENSELLTGGVDIILKSYKPIRSVIFIEAEIIDNQGKKQSIPLSITSVDFPQGFDANFDVFK